MSTPGSKSPGESTETIVFPFLRLPFELRLLCYQYLVPDILVPSYPVPSRFSTPETPTEIRADKAICTPGILGVSKQIYHEAINEFYGSARFELTVVKRGEMTFDFLGRGHFFHDDNLPPVYDLVKHLKLTIIIKGCPDSDMGDQISRIYKYCLLHHRVNALETLQIEIGSQGFLWAEHLHRVQNLKATLDRYMGPLKDMRGLKSVTVLRNMGSPAQHERRGMPEHVFISLRDKILNGVQERLDELKVLMVLPLPPNLPPRIPDLPLPPFDYIRSKK